MCTYNRCHWSNLKRRLGQYFTTGSLSIVVICHTPAKTDYLSRVKLQY